MKVVGMIPARLESSRLPSKALIDIEGLPMVIHTSKRAQLAKSLHKVYLVTDNLKIKEVGERYGIEVIMTGTHHRTGSDRIAEACANIDCDVVVNIQGDEPLVNPDHIDCIVNEIIKSNDINIAFGVTPYSKKSSPSDIKAVLDLHGNILYCSRNDIPSDARTSVKNMFKMCFIVPFRKDFLLKYSKWSPTPLEQIEYNEYLRVLEHGYKMRGVVIEDAKISVDTEDDLMVIRELAKKDVVKNLYM
ncbi:MAG: 3-deoxy-manno-octulosonate cytidylyltransferase [Oligoflexia bacterium]|nr:3-deoxy-manno-octulosonate cytidylyltransferase [Oligoflexia bacterium]